MISRYHRLIGLPPEVTPLGIYLNIHPYRPILPLICPGKCLLILPVPNKLPVLVMKRRILICPRQRQAVFQYRFSVSQSTLLLFIYRFFSISCFPSISVYNFAKYGFYSSYGFFILIINETLSEPKARDTILNKET